MSNLDTASPRAPLARVLLLDDDPFMLELLADMLDELGQFEVRRESHAHGALAALGANAPELLICDLSMPDMDGIEFMTAAANARFSGRILLLSGMDAGVRRSAERLARAHGLNVIGSFEKPLARADLQAALKGLGGASGNLYNLTTHSGK
ncbi:response regulator [Massilia sp. PAMC28688]|uniref:response regulator n=1 Tax=Massilia sp. PAMC28688 TaxID=2861283 RepID=UPI001C625F98|nr:response regulator [Massilia sp. PAMC28688]QYF95763.1 response regulator [Massilia sp. PAMC28688]